MMLRRPADQPVRRAGMELDQTRDLHGDDARFRLSAPCTFADRCHNHILRSYGRRRIDRRIGPIAIVRDLAHRAQRAGGRCRRERRIMIVTAKADGGPFNGQAHTGFHNRTTVRIAYRHRDRRGSCGNRLHPALPFRIAPAQVRLHSRFRRRDRHLQIRRHGFNRERCIRNAYEPRDGQRKRADTTIVVAWKAVWIRRADRPHLNASAVHA